MLNEALKNGVERWKEAAERRAVPNRDTSNAVLARLDPAGVKRRREQALAMLKEGKSNEEIRAALKAEHGMSVGYDILAVLRRQLVNAKAPTRRIRKTASRRGFRHADREAAVEAARKLIAAGKTNAQVRRGLQRQFGVGLGTSELSRIRMGNSRAVAVKSRPTPQPEATPAPRPAGFKPVTGMAAFIAVVDALSSLAPVEAASVLRKVAAYLELPR